MSVAKCGAETIRKILLNSHFFLMSHDILIRATEKLNRMSVNSGTQSENFKSVKVLKSWLARTHFTKVLHFHRKIIIEKIK